MKSLKIMKIVLLSFLTIGVATVNAAVVEVKDETELTSCVAVDTNTCKLMSDIEAENKITITDGKNIVIDLNNHTIAFAKDKYFNVQNASLEVTGTGEIKENVYNYGPIIIRGNEEGSTSKTKVVIGEGVTLNGWTGLFVNQTESSLGVALNSNMEIEVNGKLYGNNDGSNDGAGIYINGTVKSKTNKVTIGKTAVIDGKNGVGIYAAGYAEWNIEGATIKGAQSGIGIKSGILNLKDAKIVSNGQDTTPTEGFSNGIYSSGAAIQIESNKGYAGDIEINIDGGTYTSENSITLYEYLDSKTTDTTVKSINIKDGTFISGTGKKAILTSEEFVAKNEKFIENGTFSSDVETFVKPGSGIRKVSDSSYKVGKIYTVTVNETTNGSVTADIKEGMLSDVVKLTVKADKGYQLSELVVKDANDKEVAVTNNSFELPASNVTIIATFEKIEVKTVVPTNDPTETPKETTIGANDSEKISNILLETLLESEELKKFAEVSSVIISLDIKPIDLTETEVQKITEALENNKIKGAKLSDFFDITINVKNANTGAIIGTLPELKSEIELVVALPEDLLSVEKGYTRTYYIVRNHNGSLDIIDPVLSKDNKSLTFLSDKYSTYAIAYVDTPIPENPKTGDNIIVYVVLGLLSICSIGYIVKTKKFN